jgi:predicted RND superfamily exporter protein
MENLNNMTAANEEIYESAKAVEQEINALDRAEEIQQTSDLGQLQIVDDKIKADAQTRVISSDQYNNLSSMIEVQKEKIDTRGNLENVLAQIKERPAANDDTYALAS